MVALILGLAIWGFRNVLRQTDASTGRRAGGVARRHSPLTGQKQPILRHSEVDEHRGRQMNNYLGVKWRRAEVAGFAHAVAPVETTPALGSSGRSAGCAR